MGTRKKVLFLITKSNFGGAQRYVYDLATNMPQGFEAVVAAGGNGLLLERLKAANIRTVPILGLGRDVRLFSDLRAFFDVLSIVRRERPDILHLNSSKVGALGALAGRLCGVKRIIFTAHGWAFEEDRARLVRTLIKAISWFTILLSHQTIAVSEKMRDEMRRLPGTRSIRVIHNGIAPTRLLPREEAQHFFAEHGIPTDRILVGTIAELHPIKDLDYAIEAIARLRDRGMEMAFIIMGDGEEREKLTRLVQERDLNGSVFFLGFVPDAARYLAGLDVFTMTSLYEGLNFAILEAGAAGLPVVATHVGGIPEIIENGVTGILVPARDPSAISTAVHSLLTEDKLRERYGVALAERVHAHFSLQEMVDTTTALY
ncbi:MAG: glycosyltransferase family 4 protein [Minisyncoccia bacterium]